MLGKPPGVTTTGVFFFLALVFAAITGCAANSYIPENPPFYIQNVPFFPQEEFQCGPSVLASVLSFHGYMIEPDDISKEIYLGDIKGTLNIDMVNFARKIITEGGLSISEVQGNLTLLRDSIMAGYPLIVFVDLGFWNIRKGHYMLIAGYDDTRGGVIAYSGKEKDKFMAYDRFMHIWKRGGHWALRIIPN